MADEADRIGGDLAAGAHISESGIGVGREVGRGGAGVGPGRAAYAAIVIRGLARVFDEGNLFVMFAATALLVGIGLQAFINMASALSLMPTKGMTLPFISYGGSSFVAIAFGMGMVLALTRRRSGSAI